MSYILDALKKSEQEHKKGQVPGLGTVQGLPGPGGRFETDRLIWMYGLTTILLVAAVAVGVWLFLREPAPTPEKTPPPLTAQLPADSKAAIPTAKTPTPAKAELKPTATPPPPRTTKQPPTQPPVAGTENPELSKALSPETITPPPPTAPTPVIDKASPPPAQVEEIAPKRPPARDNGPEETEVPVKPELLPTVPIEELPAETRAEIPELKIGVHLFSDTPASRRASINGRLMREGQQVDNELVLVEIIRQGVILSFRGRKFTMPVFPR